MRYHLIVFMLFFTLIGEKLHAQQCGYTYYYLFAIHAHTPNSLVNEPGVKMYLIDEQDRPVMVSHSVFEDNQWKEKRDTLFFWEHNKLMNKPGTAPLFRQKFYNLGNVYVVAFRLENATLKDPQNYPIYQVKIEGKKYRWLSETKALPLQKAIRICDNGITSDFTLNKPIQNLGGKNYQPIDLVLDENKEVAPMEEPDSGLKYTVRFDYQTFQTPMEGMNEYLLNGARIYNTKTGKLHQEIYLPRITKSARMESTYIVKFADFYQRGITEAQDFSVQIESWRDLELKGFRQKLNYYIFNPRTKLYELDTALSNYNDVFYDEHLKVMKRYDFKATSKSRITYTYELKNKQWVLIDKNEVFFEPIPSKLKSPFSKCIVVNESMHQLPVKALVDKQSKLWVQDTFVLYNTCEDTLYITKIESGYRDFFKFNQTLLPKQQTTVVFNGLLDHENHVFDTRHINCILTLRDGSGIALGIVIPVLNTNATVYYHANGNVNYALSNRPGTRFNTAVFTYPNGQLRAKGTVQDKDTSLKVGDWYYFKEASLNSETVVYSKLISLSALDITLGTQHNNFKVKILENGKWKEPVMDAYNQEINFFITEETDSIVAYTDSTRFGFKIQYKSLPMHFKKSFYLLIPGERSLKLGYYNIPFQLIPDQYTLILNYSNLKPSNKTSYELTDTYIAKLQMRYPGITQVWVSKHQRGFSLQNLNMETKAKVMQELKTDSNVNFVCQLYYTLRNPARIGYCNNLVYAEIDIEVEEEFKKKALKLGYTKLEIDVGNNYFWLTYPDKIIDERFFEMFERLTNEKKVKAAFLNTYYEQELDSGIKE